MSCRRALLARKILLFRVALGAVEHRTINAMLFCTMPTLGFVQTSKSISSAINRTKTTLTTTEHQKSSIMKNFFKKLKLFDFTKSSLKRSGYYFYETVADGIDYSVFYNAFRMEDTFFSWYLITELHVWMLLVRVMAEGKDGRVVRNNIIEAMWEDANQRAKLLGESNPSIVRKQMKDIFEQFQAAIIGYDEGLLSEDKVLAGAVWRRLFNSDCNNPEEVESVVRYIRRQVRLLDEMPKEEILSPLPKKVTWIPLEPIEISSNT